MVTGLKPGPSSPLRIGSVGVVEFSDLLANGQAVGRFDGMVVFVDGPLPGERARIRLTGLRSCSKSSKRFKPFTTGSGPPRLK